MAGLTAKQSYTGLDAKGQVGRMTFKILYDSAEAAPDAWLVGQDLATAIQAATNLYIFSNSGPFAGFVPKQYGTAADYIDAEDKAVVVMQDTSGSLHHFAIPAPKAALFRADGQTLAGANALVVAFVSALSTAHNNARIGGSGSADFTAAPAGLVGGYRIRKRLQRRATIWTLSAGLDEPAL